MTLRPADLAESRLAGIYGAIRDFTKFGVVPGSAGKVATFIAAEEAGLGDRTFECRHRMFVRMGPDSGTVVDHPLDPVHGRITLEECMILSCNPCMAWFALQAGAAQFQAVAARGGLAHVRLGENVRGIHLASAGFGQGKMIVQVDELQRMVGGALDGTLRVCGRLAGPDEPPRCTATILTTPEVAAHMRSALLGVVTDPRGTGGKAHAPTGASYVIVGKTGTGESPLTRGETGVARPHAWFVGAIIGKDRAFSFAILSLRSGAGGAAAAPLAPRLAEILVRYGYLDGPP